ncbi:MAG: hypothetical protein Rpha_0235 [Candidatus Ruthia sp. Apha_13_S6]|nr:hypothetical protein [Candidatus Ruthia sp. Apha_13_S6]
MELLRESKLPYMMTCFAGGNEGIRWQAFFEYTLSNIDKTINYKV